MAGRVVHWEFAVLMFAGLALPIFASSKNRRVGRRLFWGGLLLAAVSGFFVFHPPDWRAGIGMSLLCITLMLITAFFNSPYLKFRGKIFAITIEDSLPDPRPDGTPSVSDEVLKQLTANSYYGGITAQKFWWLLVFGNVILSFNVIAYLVDQENPRLAAAAAAGLVTLPALCGFVDATHGYPIGNGQRVQFAIISIITVGVFPVIYFLAYRVGKPWSRYGRHARENQAGVRDQKNGPAI